MTGDIDNMDARFMAKLRNSQRKIISMESEVLQKREAVAHTRKLQQAQRDASKCSRKLGTWKQGFNFIAAPEKDLRRSDRTFPVRNYSLMDSAVWYSDEMRMWFDKYAVGDLPPPDADMLGSGYMKLKSIERSVEPQRMLSPEDSGRFDSPGKRLNISHRCLSPRSHWSDAAGLLEENRLHDAKLRASLPPPKPSVWGHEHVRGVTSPPWKERPPQEAPSYVPVENLWQRESYMKKGGGLETYKGGRAEAIARGASMRRGNGIFSVPVA